VKVLVLKNAKGKIIATFEPSNTGPKVEPTVPKGHKVEELEVAENYKSTLDVIYKKKKK